MDQTALVVIGLAVLVIVLVLLLGGGGGRRVRQGDLVALSDESRSRYIMEWDRIEARFVDAPEDAVREADSVVMSVMRERRHPLEERSLGNARGSAGRDEGPRRSHRRHAPGHAPVPRGDGEDGGGRAAGTATVAAKWPN